MSNFGLVRSVGVSARLLMVIMLIGLPSLGLAQKKAPPPKAPVPSAPPAEPLRLPGEVNDDQVMELLDRGADQLVSAGRTVKMRELIGQLGRSSCSVPLKKAPANKLTTAELVAKSRAGVVIIGDLYKCKKCPRWHVGASSGFMLSESGVCVTCYHVVNVPESPTLVAMTSDGRVVAVKEVLAANKNTDVAILQLDGTGFTPLPLDIDAPVGAPVRVVSHPDDHFFTLSEGIISRYVSVPLERNGGEVTMMAITADFGAGSSGAPVFNDRGGVVGMVNNTQSLYYDPKRGKDLQMVFKHCLPSQYVLKLIN
jgi:S1-C subfamily serine protease